MTHPSVQQATGYAAMATELERIAAALRTLRALPGEKKPWLSVSILLDTVEGVDHVAQAVFGKPGATGEHGDSWFHIARSQPQSGRGHICVQTSVPAPADEPVAP